MGVVHLATSASGLRLAVKVVHAAHAVDPEFRARFRQEVAAARRVSGAFTAPVVDADPDAERPWMATLFIDAPTLAERVRERPLGEAEATRLGAGLAEALRDIHRAGVVHRDLKPSNVLMAPDGVRVIDFGISRPADSDLRTETGKLIGTPPYMAPEQFQRPREVGTAADVFALGAVLVHAVTGRGPFDSDSHYLVAYQVVHSEPDLDGVPPGLLPVVARCLVKEPADRPTPDALLGELRAAAYPTGEDTRAFIPAPRRPATAATGAGKGISDGPGTGEPTHQRVRPPAARPGARRGRLRLATALGLGLLLTGGAVAYAQFGPGAVAGTRTETVPGADGRTAVAAAPWSVALGEQRPGNAAGACAWAATGLYCAAPGVAAARLDPADGTVGWSVPAPGAAARDAGAGVSVPLVSGEVLLVVAGGSGLLQVLDPGTGEQRWERKLPQGARVLPAGPRVMVVAEDGTVTALDARTGAELWSKRLGRTGSVWFTGPGEQGGDGGGLYASTPASDGKSSEVFAFEPVTGAKQWDRSVPGVLDPVGVARGGLYLREYDARDRTVAVVRVDLGTQVVRRTALSVPAPQAQAAVGPDGTVYVIGASGALSAVGTDREVWREELYATPTSRPVLADGKLYLMVADGRLLAVDTGQGKLAGQTAPRMGTGRGTYTAAVPAPVTGGGFVFGTAPDGSVFAVDAGNPAGW